MELGQIFPAGLIQIDGTEGSINSLTGDLCVRQVGFSGNVNIFSLGSLVFTTDGGVISKATITTFKGRASGLLFFQLEVRSK